MAKSVPLKDIKITKVSVTKPGKVNLDLEYMMGLDCEYRRDFRCSYDMYSDLYSVTKQEVFLKKAVRFGLLVGEYSFFEKNLTDIEKLARKDSEIASYVIPYYIRVGEKKKAKEIAQKIYKNKNTLSNLEILSALHIDFKEYKKAKKLINNYIDKNGCNARLCGQLLLIYAKENNIKKSIEILERLYKKTKNKEFQNEIIKLYVLSNNMKKLEEYFAFSDAPKSLLIEIYASKKMYKKAAELAYSEFLKTNDYLYLANSAVYLYEAEYKKNPKILDEVIKRFQKSVDRVKEPMFYNYYGYLLIDHNKDIKKGIEEVKKALKLEPKNEYYLDSLAWGYYKLKKCKKAYEILNKLKDKEQVEIKEHINKVKECIKGE